MTFERIVIHGKHTCEQCKKVLHSGQAVHQSRHPGGCGSRVNVCSVRCMRAYVETGGYGISPGLAALPYIKQHHRIVQDTYGVGR